MWSRVVGRSFGAMRPVAAALAPQQANTSHIAALSALSSSLSSASSSASSSSASSFSASFLPVDAGAVRAFTASAAAAAKAPVVGMPVPVDDRTVKSTQTPGQTALAEELAHYYGRKPTHHELTLFSFGGEELAPIEDHGNQWGIPAELTAGRPEVVQRVVSTYTADTRQARAFRVQQVIHKYRLQEYDTGSSRVSVAVLTEHIKAMGKHLSAHPKDMHAKKALSALLSRRKRLLQYMMRKDYNNYRIMLRELGLRPLPLFSSPYPPQFLMRKRTPHAEIHARRARVRSRKRRGHKGH